MPADVLVRMARIDKTYNAGSAHEKAMFRGFDLAVKRGDFVCVIGSNGSGKTSLLNLLCGSLAPDAGCIELAGRRIDQLAEFKRSRVLGRVFQDPAKGTCAGLTILENMALADNKGRRFGLRRGVNRARADEYRRMLAGLEIGLEDALEQRVGNLSGGQRQALALLIATMTPIDLLILDEHTAALDPKSSEMVMRLTARIVRERKLTALMVTHNLKYALAYGNRLLMLHQGGIVLDVADERKRALSHEELLRTFTSISVELSA